MHDDLFFRKKILVVAVRKSFWASNECALFPNRIYVKQIYGHSQHPINIPFIFFCALIGYCIHRPKLLLLASVPSIVFLFLLLKKIGLMPFTKIVVINQPGVMTISLLKCIDCMIVNSKDEITVFSPHLRNRFKFILLPADGNFEDVDSVENQNYIFSGGGAERDFPSIVDAIKGIDIELRIVTFEPQILYDRCEVPDNCRIFGRMSLDKFIEMMRKSRFVILPLKKGLFPHGHTTIAQAFRCGKAVITTSQACVDDYVAHGHEGLLVKPYDSEGYRKAILRLIENDALVKKMEANVALKARELTYAVYAEHLSDTCIELLRDAE